MFRYKHICKIITLAVGLGCGAECVSAEGIPEPSLVLYGTIKNVFNNGDVRLTSGTLDWTFTPALGGDPIVASVLLTNVNDQFSYAAMIPIETPIGNGPVTSTTLQLTAIPTVYTLSAMVDAGTAAFVTPAQAQVTVSANNRGLLQRIDLEVSVAPQDSDSNGLPDAWEIAHFGGIGVDPNDDADGDFMSNGDEYVAGTNPQDAQSVLVLLDSGPDPQGGFVLQWSCVPNQFYKVLRSEDLLSNFMELATHIPATPPINSYHDASAVGKGPYFYRVQIQD